MSEIVFDPKEQIWQIRNMDTEKILVIYRGEELYPVGLGTWSVVTEVCTGQGNTNVSLMLSR